MTRHELWLWMRLNAAGAWRSKTIWTAGAMAGVAAFEERSSAIYAYLGPHAASRVMFCCAVAMAVLRFVTSTSLSEKVPGTGPSSAS
jgi:hypothetical protein